MTTVDAPSLANHSTQHLEDQPTRRPAICRATGVHLYAFVFCWRVPRLSHSKQLDVTRAALTSGAGPGYQEQVAVHVREELRQVLQRRALGDGRSGQRERGGRRLPRVLRVHGCHAGVIPPSTTMHQSFLTPQSKEPRTRALGLQAQFTGNQKDERGAVKPRLS